MLQRVNIIIRVALVHVNLFLHVFSYLKVIWTMEQWKIRNSLELWHFVLELTTCPIVIFTCNRLMAAMFEIFMLLTSRRIGRRTPFKIIWQLIASDRRLMSIELKLRDHIFTWRRRKCKPRSLVKAADAIVEHSTRKKLAFTDTSSMWLVLRSSKFFSQ